MDQYEYVTWEDWGRFSEADVHHQYAIALKTPPYRTSDIDKSVRVYIQLYRPGDNSHSEPVEFRYKPSTNFVNNTRKRPRVSSNYNSAEIPLVISDQHHVFAQPDQYQPNQQQLHQQQQQRERQFSQTISTEYDTQKLIQEALLNAADSTTNPTTESLELSSSLFDSACMNSEEIMNFVNTTFECYDDDHLAKDAVSDNEIAVGDNEFGQAKKLTDSERFMLSLLKKVWPLMMTTQANIQKGHNFLENLFTNASFNGER